MNGDIVMAPLGGRCATAPQQTVHLACWWDVRVLLMIVAMLAPMAGASGATARGQSACGPPKAKTIERSDQARAYRLGDTLYVCNATSRRTYRLGAASYCADGSGGECGGVRQVHVSGRFVSSVDYLAAGSLRNTYFTLRVRDTASGRIRHRVRQGKIARTQAYLERLVLDAHGNVAWITTLGDYTDATPVLEVRRSSGCGPAVLDRGTQINPTLLRLTGGRVTWRHTGELRTAALCPTR